MTIDDEHIALLEKSLANIENDYTPTCETVNYGSGCPGATDASREFWRRAVDVLPSLIAELRSLRLSAEDVEALRWFREWAEPRLDLGFDNDNDCEHCAKGTVALSTLDRLLGTRGGE
jgi:hypothetical protein